jgi:acyl-CoA thioesterase-1
VALALSLATGALAYPGPAGGGEPGELVILCLGDSLTEGYGVAPEHSYPELLAQRLRGLGYARLRIINAGISGSTSASGVARLKWQLRAKPDFLILELGGNDGLRGIDLLSTRKNLSATIALAKSGEVEVLLAGMKIPPNYGPEYTRDFEALFGELAREHGVALIPFFLEGVAGHPDLNLPDGIHPTAEGYQIVVQNLLESLLPLLPGPTQPSQPRLPNQERGKP